MDWSIRYDAERRMWLAVRDTSPRFVLAGATPDGANALAWRAVQFWLSR